ncbi:MAG: hypothetical protein IJF59_05925, partial [Clostridia bacterium]|nr:hypothetical protein [Clostridia bacterium]
LTCAACREQQPADAPQPEQGEAPAAQYPDLIALPYVKNASLDPLSTTSRVNLELSTLLYDPLVTLDESLTPVPALAESVTVRDLVVTIRLKENLRFSDGSPLTSTDLLYTLGRIQLGGTNFDARLKNVASMEAIDGRTVRLTLLAPNSLFASLLEIPILKAPGEDEEPSADAALPRGSGKYILSASGDRLIANAGWPLGEVALTEISLVDAPDSEAAAFALSTGEVTLTTAFGGKSSPGGLRYVSNSLVYLGVNPGSAALSTAGLRRALSAALSRPTLIDDNISLGGFVALSPLCSRWALYDDAAVSRGHDLSYAAAVLAQEGYDTVGEDGVRLKNAGQRGERRLSLRLLYSSASGERAALAASVANQLRAIGYEVTLQELPQEQYLAQVTQGGFDLYLGEVRLTPDMDLTPLVGSGGALNYGGYSSPVIDSALEGVRTASGEELPQAGTLLVAALDSEMPLIPLYYAQGEIVCPDSAVRALLEPTAAAPLRGIERVQPGQVAGE